MGHTNPEVRSAYNKAYRLKNLDRITAHKKTQYAANREAERARNRALYAAKRTERLARAAAYRQAHPEQCLEATQRWRTENAEAIQAKRVADYAANPEYFRKKARKHYRLHPERMKARNATRDKQALVRAARRWQLAHPEQNHAIKARRRARQRQAPRNDLTAAQWREIKAAYKQCCLYCSRKMQRLTQDHITPLSKGGSHTVSNVVPACASCNSRKHAGPPLCPVQPLLLTLAPAREECA